MKPRPFSYWPTDESLAATRDRVENDPGRYDDDVTVFALSHRKVLQLIDELMEWRAGVRRTKPEATE